MFFKFLIALHLLLLSVSTTVKANTKFLFCIENYDAKPYYYTSETSGEHDNNLKGVLVEVATKAAEKVGWSAEIVRHPWLRCQHLVKQGKIHGLLTMIKNEDRLQQFAFPPNELYLAEVKLAIIAKRGGYSIVTLPHRSLCLMRITY
ncbi:transporter substrate-binding domain-containing protein [Paraglaciecola aquimarina]|uniref:Transporter substrate-binding domain-containing protein n=1 Tax=Paraglaciecola aquimarina TaxID=1235557 RepID=A0ABU3SXR7_9ALTE|nr:transporter substrate-binding domain-containing protein [Paraglaciecola aquimarina]MDU0354811.1 transporter substrate-binding domain-containing protein [Paraglaciecola aquimarina]